ncbi:HAD family hydrolase [bacterium]|nr:HAD family hydrolase [bacterium]
MRRLILLDRDGTVMVNKHYLVDPDGVELIPGVAEGIQRLNEAGHAVAIISNQSGVARGMMTVNDVAKVNARLLAVLHIHGAAVDNIYFCPEVDDDAPCRKPNTGMLEQAARDMELPLAEGVVVGDNVADIEAGKRAGCRTVLVRTGYGADVEKAGTVMPDATVDSLREAVEWILAEL